ncbi:MAG TPA: arginine repressor [Actinomycetota bacterium]|nr:arginine repressor [Actinomycetota bacterium]
MRSERRRALLRILRGSHAATQHELVEALRAEGFDVTQATVSRDLHELRAVKVRDGGEVAYRFPEDVPRLRGRHDGVAAELAEFAIDVRDAGSLVVIATLPGHASAVARAVDLANVPAVRGTIAGDDTIFVATPDGVTARDLAAQWRAAVFPTERISNG